MEKILTVGKLFHRYYRYHRHHQHHYQVEEEEGGKDAERKIVSLQLAENLDMIDMTMKWRGGGWNM